MTEIINLLSDKRKKKENSFYSSKIKCMWLSVIGLFPMFVPVGFSFPNSPGGAIAPPVEGQGEQSGPLLPPESAPAVYICTVTAVYIFKAILS